MSRDEELGQAQREHWSRVYAAHPGMYGTEPSQPARYAADRFSTAGVQHVLELGSGHGRDALYFARRGFEVTAADFSAGALTQLRQGTEEWGVADRVRIVQHDVRDRLPLAEACVDGVFAHMLLCMALSTGQIHDLVGEVRRVLRPGGLFIYTVRHTGDAHCGSGINHGDNIYEHGGFAVHFFDRALVDDLADGWILDEVHAFEEGELPRRLWRITQRSRLTELRPVAHRRTTRDPSATASRHSALRLPVERGDRGTERRTHGGGPSPAGHAGG